MKPINGIANFLVVGLSATVLLACENKMERAKQALDEISYTVARNWLDGTKYVPAEVAHVQQELAIVQGAYGSRNYATVPSRAPAVLADAKCVATFATLQYAEAIGAPGTGSGTPGGTAMPRLTPRSVTTSATHINADRELALNAALERELALTSERLQYRKRELRWMISIIMLSGVVLVLLSWMLIANVRHRRALLVLAEQDGLTGLPNRRRTTERATAALAEAEAGRRPLTLALIDLDHFKKINDRCGHAIGDHVLKEFARRSRGLLRAADTLGRWGGEEFLLVLPDTQIESAVAIMQRMQSALAEVQLPATVPDLSVSFSAGLATRTMHSQSLDEVVARADAALYEAKNGGRNLLRLDRETRRAAASADLLALGDPVSS